MKWFEYIIMLIAIGLVLLPIAIKINNKKKGNSCGSCCCCDKKDSCLKNFKQYINQVKSENK